MLFFVDPLIGHNGSDPLWKSLADQEVGRLSSIFVVLIVFTSNVIITSSPKTRVLWSGVLTPGK